MSAFDRTATLDRLAGDAALLVEIATLYAATARAQLQVIGAALADGNLEKVYRESHSLKGATSVFEALAAATSLAELESAARAGDRARVVALAPRVDTLARELIGDLENRPCSAPPATSFMLPITCIRTLP
jgi:HPt (histidine-containing phosphotransfer) domain-containing protein